jgi:hypothetical protein
MDGKKQVELVRWDKIADEVSIEYNISRELLDKVSEAIMNVVNKVIAEKQPKCVGDTLNIETPFVLYGSTKVHETKMTDLQGKEFLIPASCDIRPSIPKELFISANTNLISREELEVIRKRLDV